MNETTIGDIKKFETIHINITKKQSKPEFLIFLKFFLYILENILLSIKKIKYPKTVPVVFVIISFISVALNPNIWESSIKIENIIPVNTVYIKFILLLESKGINTPKGIKSSIFRIYSV